MRHSVLLQILEHLAVQRPDTGVTALAAALGCLKAERTATFAPWWSRTTSCRRRAATNTGVGSRLITLGRSVAESFDLVSVARPIMRELRDLLGHPVVLSQVDPGGARVLATLLGKAPIEISVREGSVLSFHGSSQGKVALAWGDEALRSRVLSRRLEMFTPHTIASPAALRAELVRVRERGWAVSPNETLSGVNALAAPLFDGSGGCVGAVAIVDSIQFVEPLPLDEQVIQVVATAVRISRALGFTGRQPAPGSAVDEPVQHEQPQIY